MDINSVEFYALALLVAMALLGLLFGDKPHTPAVTGIAQFRPARPCADPDIATVTLAALPGGNVELLRQGLPLAEGGTAFVVATIVDDKMTVVEKQGIHSAAEPLPLHATATLDCLPQGRRLHVRYESELTGQWCTFAFTNAQGRNSTAQLKY